MTKSPNNDQTKEQNIQIILETIKKKKPQTTRQLVELLKLKLSLPTESISSLIIELENEEKIKFTKKQDDSEISFQKYAFSTKAFWYWSVIALSIATAIAAITIPDTAYPFVYVRLVLSLTFALVLPGYTFIKVLFPSQLPIKTSGEDIDNIERAGLSFGMSLVIVPIVCLVLNYLPWGIRLTPITLSLFALSSIFATTGLYREYQGKAQSSSHLNEN